MNKLEFENRCFCFTGKLAELKRSHAEREARSRGAQTTKVVNGQLDFLVVGSIPATGWKHGSYGLKIEKAKRLVEDGSSRLQLVPEHLFMESLAQVPPTNSGAIDAKVVVITYKFIAPDRKSFDKVGFERIVGQLREDHEFHVRVSAFFVSAQQDLFRDDSLRGVPESYLVFEARFVKQMPIEDQAGPVAEAIERALEPLVGVDGSVRWFERTEGSADYVRLLRELPEELRVPGL